MRPNQALALKWFDNIVANMPAPPDEDTGGMLLVALEDCADAASARSLREAAGVLLEKVVSARKRRYNTLEWQAVAVELERAANELSQAAAAVARSAAR